MSILHFKALHLIFMVTWFAGLFYIVRLFIYQKEASEKEEPTRTILISQFKIMQKRLWYGITWPSAILILISALPMLYLQPSLLTQAYMQLKLALVFGLFLYHIYCHRIFLQQQRDSYLIGSFRLRLWNEVATIFLVSIVFIITLRNMLDWVWGLLGIFIFALLILLAVKMYKSSREKKEHN